MSVRVPEERDVAATVSEALLAHPRIRSATLVGSRARGTSSPLSDWDLAIDTDDPDAVISAFPALVTPLHPLAQQWDRLGPPTYRCYMLMLNGPTKVDLILPGVPHEPAPPWSPTHENLEAIDHHFWDWILWLTAKQQGGKHDLVLEQLELLSGHILRPLGADDVPTTIAGATEQYVAARDRIEAGFGVRVSRRVEEEVWPVLPGA